MIIKEKPICVIFYIKYGPVKSEPQTLGVFETKEIAKEEFDKVAAGYQKMGLEPGALRVKYEEYTIGGGN